MRLFLYKWGLFLVSVFRTGALLFGVYFRDPFFLRTPIMQDFRLSGTASCFLLHVLTLQHASPALGGYKKLNVCLHLQACTWKAKLLKTTGCHTLKETTIPGK